MNDKSPRDLFKIIPYSERLVTVERHGSNWVSLKEVNLVYQQILMWEMLRKLL